MFKRLTDRLCNVYTISPEELAEITGEPLPVRQAQEVAVQQVHVVHHHYYHQVGPTPVHVETTVIRGEIVG